MASRFNAIGALRLRLANTFIDVASSDEDEVSQSGVARCLSEPGDDWRRSVSFFEAEEAYVKGLEERVWPSLDLDATVYESPGVETTLCRLMPSEADTGLANAGLPALASAANGAVAHALMHSRALQFAGDALEYDLLLHAAAEARTASSSSAQPNHQEPGEAGQGRSGQAFLEGRAPDLGEEPTECASAQPVSAPPPPWPANARLVAGPTPGSVAHPHLCKLPCRFFFDTGTCPNGEHCSYCHLDHDRRGCRLDKKNRLALMQMPTSARRILLATVVSEKVEQLNLGSESMQVLETWTKHIGVDNVPRDPTTLEGTGLKLSSLKRVCFCLQSMSLNSLCTAMCSNPAGVDLARASSELLMQLRQLASRRGL